MAVLLAALSGVFVSYLQVVDHYRTAADQLNESINLSSQLTDQITTHESLAHSLWNGDAVDRPLYLTQQDSISSLLAEGATELQSAEQLRLLDQVTQTWRQIYVSRGLWGPSSAARPGVTLALQQQFGSDSDQVTVTLGTLTKVAIADGARDIAKAHALQAVLVGLLISQFALIFAVIGYFARRMTVDVLIPVESLHEAVTILSEGNLQHRVLLRGDARPNELGDLADAFNIMANELDKNHQDLSRQATQDALTGLVNRATFERELARRFRPSNRGNPDSVSILFIDVDDFKLVNDSLGHAAGDALLTGVAERLSNCVRDRDVVARVGGDEFAVLVIDPEDGPQPAIGIAERLLDGLVAPFVIDNQEVHVSASIGIAVRQPDTIGPAELVAQGDFAMYTAKAQGKGRHQIFDSAMRAAVTNRTSRRPTAAEGIAAVFPILWKVADRPADVQASA